MYYRGHARRLSLFIHAFHFFNKSGLAPGMLSSPNGITTFAVCITAYKLGSLLVELERIS